MESNNAVVAILLGLLAIILISAAARGVFRSLSHLHLHRSILVHVPAERAWSRVSDLPHFVSRHGRVHGGAAIDDWALREGDGRSVGSVWRGVARDRKFWVDLQITRREPVDEICFRLIRDSYRTHRSLHLHRASLKLREVSPGVTKITWELQARLRGTRLLLLRLFAPSVLHARLLDVSLRTVKASIETLEEERAAVASAGAKRSGGEGAIDPRDLLTPSPSRPPRPPEASV